VSSNASQALASAEEGLAHEPYNEKLARLAMQAEATLGLRSAVINRYDNLRQLLEEQLGLQPHRETRALYRQLLSQDQQPERSPSALAQRCARLALSEEGPLVKFSVG
jgi:DNA-binding SARP family transcriptional activator